MFLKKILKKLSNYLFSDILLKQKRIETNIDTLLFLNAKEIIEQQRANSSKFINDYEFKVFSQWGDDGIIQFLIREIEIKNEVFVEFGTENYKEANTRFLLINNNWNGLIIDDSVWNINSVINENLYWRYNLTAVSKFITKENINDIFIENGIVGDIGLLSIDIDGNDYWIWDAINVVTPRIVICEYNSVFGKNKAITIPYKVDFNRTKAHYSNLYFGASLKALTILADKKGYDFIGCNSNGVNAYFIRKDVNTLPKTDVQNGYVLSKTRESRDKNNNLTFVSSGDRIMQILDKKVFDIEQNSTFRVNDIINQI